MSWTASSKFVDHLLLLVFSPYQLLDLHLVCTHGLLFVTDFPVSGRPQQTWQIHSYQLHVNFLSRMASRHLAWLALIIPAAGAITASATAGGNKSVSWYQAYLLSYILLPGLTRGRGQPLLHLHEIASPLSSPAVKFELRPNNLPSRFSLCRGWDSECWCGPQIF